MSDVAELVRERQAAPARADAGAIEDHGVADAREIARDERLADAPAAGEQRDDDDVDGARVAIVMRLEERALLERSGDRVHVAEVLRDRRRGRPSRYERRAKRR